MSEFLVLFACLNSTGCTEATSHYLAQNPEVYVNLHKNEDKIKRFIGPKVVTFSAPLLYAAAGGTGVVRLNKYFTANISRNQGLLAYGLEF